MRQMRNAVLGSITLLALAAMPASADPQPRVIGGQVANPAEWPATVALTAGGSERQFCGGTLIAPQQVLTARHCTLGPIPNFEAVTGRADLTTADGQEISVVAKHRHPRADIAVLDLQVPSVATPFPVATRSQDSAATNPGDSTLVAGWGSTRPRGGPGSDVLREGEQLVRRGNRCGRAFPFFRNETMICALGRKLGRNQHGSACYGDSGGPLVADTPQDRVLVGTVSGGGRICGKPRKPSFYVRVAKFRGWILDQVP